jgi:hypothetical protein
VNQNGECRLGQDTIAARLGVTRQAVNKHLAQLEGWGYLTSLTPKNGVTKRYIIATEEFETRRADEYRVKVRREKKAAERRSSSGKVQPSEVAGSEVEHLQSVEVVGVQPVEVSPGATSGGCTPCNSHKLHKETSSETSVREFQERGAGAALPNGRDRAAPPEDMKPGGRFVHDKFGLGTIAAINDNKLTVDFDQAGRKMVLDSFVRDGAAA